MNKNPRRLLTAPAGLLFVCGAIGLVSGIVFAENFEADRPATGRAIGTIGHPPQAPATQPSARNSFYPNGISYHGGPVLTAGTSVYYIWYGNWSGNSATTILPVLASNLGGSPYFRINTTYFNGAGAKVQNLVNYKGAMSMAYPYGSSLTDTNIQQIVAAAIQSGSLGSTVADPNGVYFVLTSPDVKETSGFCTSYCGWHTHFAYNGVDVKYAFIGDAATQCPSACEWQTSTSPNGNPGADGMASVIAHELEEATTDPDLNAWFDSRGYENADKCAWHFGTTYSSGSGSIANMSLGGLNFLIQQNWVNASGGYCALSY